MTPVACRRPPAWAGQATTASTGWGRRSQAVGAARWPAARSGSAETALVGDAGRRGGAGCPIRGNGSSIRAAAGGRERDWRDHAGQRHGPERRAAAAGVAWRRGGCWRSDPRRQGLSPSGGGWSQGRGWSRASWSAGRGAAGRGRSGTDGGDGLAALGRRGGPAGGSKGRRRELGPAAGAQGIGASRRSRRSRNGGAGPRDGFDPRRS